MFRKPSVLVLRSCGTIKLSLFDDCGPRLVGLGIPEVNQDPIAHVLRYEAPEALHGLRNALLIGRNDLAEVCRVHPRGQGRGANQVGEHHCDLAALGAVFW
jgi:hypothetical protein